MFSNLNDKTWPTKPSTQLLCGTNRLWTSIFKYRGLSTTKFLQHQLAHQEQSINIAMAAIWPLRHRRRCSFGAASVVVALLVPRAHVPPAWWQGGWPRQSVGSAEEVELLSPLAAMLMPKTRVGELFRNFPSPNAEEDLEPSLTAYGIMKDPKAALFIHYDGRHGKRGGLNDDFRKQLLAYGPPGSYILHISHTKSRRLEDMVLSIKAGAWHPGDEASLSHVLTGICTKVSLALGDVMCPEVLEHLHSKKVSQNTSDLHDFRKFCVACRGTTVNQESLEHRLFAEGFSPASIECMLNRAHLSGKFVEAKLESRMQRLSNLGQSQSQIREAIATSFPVLGDTLQKNVKPTLQWFSNLGLDQQQVGKAIANCPSIFGSNALQTLQATVLWLLDLGLSHRQVVKVVGRCPEVLDAGNPIREWFFKLGMNTNEIRKGFVYFLCFLVAAFKRTSSPNWICFWRLVWVGIKLQS